MVRRQNSRSLLGCRDLAAVRQHRGDHNRLGFVVRFCYPRYTDRVLAENETPPAALLGVVVAQLQVQPPLWDGYAQRDFFRHHLGPTTREEDRIVDGYLFRTAAGKTGVLTQKPLSQPDAYRSLGLSCVRGASLEEKLDENSPLATSMPATPATEVQPEDHRNALDRKVLQKTPVLAMTQAQTCHRSRKCTKVASEPIYL